MPPLEAVRRPALVQLRAPLLCAGALASAGCWEMGKGGDAKIPGDLLGDYAIEAELQSSTCGEGALGSQERWTFDVRLSREGSALYWLNGQEAISGLVSADGVSFAIETSIKVQAQAPGRGHPGCAIWRSDRTTGTLMGQGSDVPGLTGELRFAYAPEQKSDCSELLGVAGGFAGLPCEMTYRYAGVRR